MHYQNPNYQNPKYLLIIIKNDLIIANPSLGALLSMQGEAHHQKVNKIIKAPNNVKQIMGLGALITS